ncbi:hypothetical protein TIFTF001_008175 [Ficus carica]|uniref:Polyphenol oxidase C-terminal domain-containing protein n=1 Tax=Ficus carica TaxID=3494 RepID=A0AA87ZS12_FICCA|nr:hypothetical protein TIFTF001_008175 [Ficus carica]
MENNNNNNDFSLDSNDSSTLLRRRDILLSATTAAAAAAAAAAVSPIRSSFAATAAEAAAEFPIKLEGTVSRVVSRPRRSRSKREKEEEEEVLVIDGIQFDRNFPVKFDVYVNDDCSDGGSGPTAAEFAGSLVNVPHGRRGTIKTCLRLAITDLLESVGADDDDSVLVTLVPKSGVGLVSVGNIGIELLS